MLNRTWKHSLYHPPQRRRARRRRLPISNIPAQVLEDRTLLSAITHDVSGNYEISGQQARIEQIGSVLTFANERGEVSSGEILNETQVVAFDWDGGLIGQITGERIEWANGTVWSTRVISGEFKILGQPTRIEQFGNALTFINERGEVSSGHILNDSKVVAFEWEQGLTAQINGGRFEWANGSVWSTTEVHGDYGISGQQARIEQVGNVLTFTNERGEFSSGRVLNDTQVVALDWAGGLIGQIKGGRIEWENGSTWSVPEVSRRYEIDGQSSRLEQNGNGLTLINERGDVSLGRILSLTRIIALDWQGGLIGEFNDNRIDWANGSTWKIVPPVISEFDLATAFDTSPVGDRSTSFSTVTLAGTTDHGANVVLMETGSTTTADAAGRFEFRNVTLLTGQNRFTARATDVAGNQSAFAADFNRVATGVATLTEFELIREFTIPVELGQSQGTRTIRVDFSAVFDTLDTAPAVEDLFLVSLVDPLDPSRTLLDRGVTGTTLFSLAGNVAEFAAGLVRYDGTGIDIDVTSLGGLTEGTLLFQLINSDADTGSVVTVDSIANSLDEEGVAAPEFPTAPTPVVAGADFDTSLLTPSSDVAVLVGNVRFSSTTGRYTAEIRLRNDGPSISRQAVVSFPGLPQDVQFVVPSGITADGTPYVNLRNAIPAGGLKTGQVSNPVQIAFDDPAIVPFSLTPTALVAGENHAPQFDAVGPLTVMPGGHLEVPLTATDPDGDRVMFSIIPSEPLPTGSLRANGTLVFTPSPDELGHYEFRLVASDGSLQTPQSVTLDVVADPFTTTRISGIVLDVDGTRLTGVPISLSRIIVLTDGNGEFTLELPSLLLPTEVFDISVPMGDVYFDPFNTGAQTIAFHRAGYDTLTGTDANNPRRHPNLVSSFLDGSVVYGSDVARAQALRKLDGSGHLKTSAGDLLPLNNTTYFPNGPLENDQAGPADPTTLFVAGDVRASENPGLSALQTVLLREHNRLADQIAAAEPSLTGDEIYQQARRLVIAEIQHITYSEYLPVLLGPGALPSYAGYDPAADPQVGTLFASAAFRIGHSQATPEFSLLDEAGDQLPGGPLPLLQAFFNTEPIRTEGIDLFLRGLAAELAEQVDPRISDALRNTLFGPPGSGGLDLGALSIQRGRDMGLPAYNQARKDLGLAPVTSFDDITSDATIRQALANTYGGVEDVDVFVGGLAEDHVAGALVGELIRTVLGRQFQATRDGDRFWYENGQFKADELDFIRSTTLASLIERNTGITGLPGNVFTTGSSPASPPASGTAADSPTGKFRSFDGTGNNPSDPARGSAGQHLRIDAGLYYADGISAPAGSSRPGAREISNALMNQTSSLPDPAGTTLMAVYWGQLLSHDLSLTPTGISETLKIHADDVSTESAAYPFVAEKLDLLLGHPVYAGVDNVISRPIFLPMLDTVQAQAVDPDVDTMVAVVLAQNEAPAQVFVAAGTLMDQDGNPFTGDLSITEVPVDRTPAALPENLFPDVVVTIQPGEMVFTQPAPLTLPNRAGYAPGTEMDLWSINPVTGLFDNVGTGRVSDDGSVIETVEGGIRNSSWHFVAPGVAQQADEKVENQDQQCQSCEATVDSNSQVELHSGALLEQHNLVSYQSLGADRPLTLHYNSQRADVRPIIHFGFDNVETNSSRLLVASLNLSRGEFETQVAGFEGGLGLPGGEHFWQLPTEGGDVTVALQADLRGLGSGRYDYEIDQGLMLLGDNQLNGASTTVSGTLVVVDASQSALGAGWQIGGVQQLIENPDGTLLFIDGNGTSLVFEPPESVGTPFVSPPGDFTTLVRNPDGTFTRTTTDRTVFEFDVNGRLVSITDRNGNQTRHLYDGDRLMQIIDPAGLTTEFAYLGNRVTAITDPAGRVTSLQYDSSGNLISITDPDGIARQFEYDDNHHLTAETNQRGFREETHYGFHGRVEGSVHADGATQSFRPLQTRILLPPEATIDPFNAPLAANSLEPVTFTTNANGNVTRTNLDRAGQTIDSSDASGPGDAIERNANNLVTSVTNSGGDETTFQYDELGNLTRIVDELSGTRFVSANTLFALPVFPAGLDPNLIRSGDLNGDGHVDIVTGNLQGNGDLSLYFGNGDGTFDARQDLVLASLGPSAIELADINRDGVLDIIVAGSSAVDASISILLGDGVGGIATEITTLLPPHAREGVKALRLADLDRDGNLDIALLRTRNISGSPVTRVNVLYGNGDGKFDDNVVEISTPEMQDIDVGDIDGDGDLDIVTVRTFTSFGNASALATLYRSNGDRSFELPVEFFGVFAHANRIVLADLNDDQIVDMLLGETGRTGFPIRVFLGNGDETFSLAGVYNFGNGDRFVNAIEVLDVTADGILDVVATNGSRYLTVLEGSGDGSFLDPVDFTTGMSHDFAFADFNEDDLLDAVSANSQPGIVIAQGVSLGAFASVDDYGLNSGPDSFTGAVALGDVNEDGFLDAFVADRNSDSGFLFIGNGDGSFRSPTQFAVGDSPVDVGLADLNGDGHLDAVTYNYTDASISVLLGDGFGDFGAAQEIASGTSRLSTPTAEIIEFGDMNRDGFLDIVTIGTDLNSSAAVFLGDGAGNFNVIPTSQEAARTLWAIELADVDGDGNLDLVTGEFTNTPVSVAFGNGDGTFSPRIDFPIPNTIIFSVTVADLDDDGDADILAAGTSFWMIPQISPGAFGQPIELEGSIRTSTRAVNLIDVNLDGIEDIVGSDGSYFAVEVLPGLGGGQFGDPRFYASSQFVQDTAFGDIDRDGDIDFVSVQPVTPAPAITVSLNTTIQPPNTGGTGQRTFTYDPVFNQLTSVTDELGRRTLYEIDPNNGNTLSITRLVGKPDSESGESDDVVTRFTYTPLGLVDTVIDPLGRVTDYDYDPLGRLETVTFAVATLDEATQRFEYDAAGNQTAFVDENGNRTEYEYDLLNRLTRVIEADPDGPTGALLSPVTTFQYDAAGNLIKTTDAGGSTTRVAYDELDRPVRTTDTNGEITRFEYDPVGNLRFIVDPLLNVTQNRYDARGRLVETIDPDGGRTQFRYDPDDNLKTVIDPLGNRTNFAHDARDRLIREIDPLDNVIQYAYDPVDNLVATTDRNGRTTRYEYDDLDRLTTETWLVSGTSAHNVIEYSYDAVGNVLSASDRFSALAFSYDARDRVTRVDNAGTPGAPHLVLDYAYDPAGNVLSVTDTTDGVAGAVTSYAYDALKRNTQVAQTGNGVADKRVDLAYNPLGQFENISRYSDLGATQLVASSDFNYDALNRLTNLSHENTSHTVAFYDFTYDAAGRLTSLADVDGRTTFNYDRRGQLTAADRPDGGPPDETYDYDANGNRTTSSQHGDGYQTGTANRLLSDGTFDYEYDNEGNLARRTEIATGNTREFQWDHRNRLTAVVDKNAAGNETQRVEFTYDAFDRRISKSVDTTPIDAIDAFFTRYVYDREDVLFDFTDPDGAGPAPQTLARRYLHGPAIDQVFAQEDAAGNVAWLLPDHLGTTRDLVDDAGQVLNHIQYDSFGNVVSESAPANSTRYLFTGREFDPETGLYFYRARYYDAGTGRFVSEDPIGIRGSGVNLSKYAKNSPFKFADPSGLTSIRSRSDVIPDPIDLLSAITEEELDGTTGGILLDAAGRFQLITTAAEAGGKELERIICERDAELRGTSQFKNLAPLIGEDAALEAAGILRSDIRARKALEAPPRVAVAVSFGAAKQFVKEKVAKGAVRAAKAVGKFIAGLF